MESRLNNSFIIIVFLFSLIHIAFNSIYHILRIVGKSIFVISFIIFIYQCTISIRIFNRVFKNTNFSFIQFVRFAYHIQ